MDKSVLRNIVAATKIGIHHVIYKKFQEIVPGGVTF